MSVLDSLKNKLGFKSEFVEFYQDQTVSEVKWWLADGLLYPKLHWARLRVFSNGKADVLFEDEDKSYGFENEEFAGYFLSADEFIDFDSLDDEDRNFLEIPPEIKINVPDWAGKEVEKFEYIGKY